MRSARSVRPLAVLALVAAIAGSSLPAAVAAPPGAPAFNAVTVPSPSANTTLQLQYGSVTGATSYAYIMNGGAPVSMGLTQPFTVTGLTPGTLYCFQLTATTADGTSAPSETKCAIPGLAQDPTTRLAITGITTVSPGTLAIDYTRPSDPAGMDAINIRVNGSFFAWAYDLRSPLIVPGFTQGATVSVQIKGGVVGYMPDSLFSDATSVTVGAGSGGGAAPVITAPGAPGITVLETTATSIRYRLDPPSATGGQAPYVYEAGIRDGVMQSFNPNELERTVTGLEPGRSYVLLARARNDAGWGPDALATAITSTARPAPPTQVTAIGGVRSATVSWQPPASNGGSPITAYVVRVGEREVRLGPDDRTATVDGLPSWSELPVSVVAESAIGVSERAETRVSTARSAASKVRNLTAETIGRGTVRLRWDPPVDAGDPAAGPLRYLPQYQVSTPLCGYTLREGKRSPFIDGTSCIASGLAERVPITMFVSAIDSRGYLVPGTSASVRHTILPTVPAAPQDLEVTVGEGATLLRWQPPSTSDETGVDEYLVRASTTSADAGGGLARVCLVKAPATTCAIQLPVRGVYAFQVAAINDEGRGPWSDPREARVSEVPTAAVTVTDIAPRTARLVIATPADRGLLPDLEYAYVVTAADGTKVASGRVPAGRSVIELSRLTPGSSARVDVRAVSAFGSGPTEQRFFSLPADVPGAPILSASVTAANEVRLRVGLSDDGGDVDATVDAEIVDADGVGAWNQQNVAIGAPTLIGPLAPGRTFTVRAVAVNRAGASATSTTTIETAATLPGPPVAVRATGGPRSISITWQPPAADGGRPILGYVVESEGGSGKVRCEQATAEVRECTITGLRPDAPATATVAARTTMGVGPAVRVEAVPAATAPDAPGVVVRKVTDQTAIVDMTPIDDGGRAITASELTVIDVATGKPVTGVGTLPPSGGSVTVGGLTGGGAYQARVRLSNAIGWSAVTTRPFTTAPGAPAAPTAVTAAPGARSLVIAWQRPARDGGSAITGYTATAEPGAATCRATIATTCTIADLDPRVEYRVSVTASNGNGRGPASAAVTGRPVYGVPGAPAIAVAGRTGTTTTLAFAPPADVAGDPTVTYEVTVRPAGSTKAVETRTAISDPQTTFTTLRPGEVYTASARARNSVGLGPESTISFVATSAPGVPTGVGADVLAFNEPPRITVTFEPPSSSGDPGTYITRYEILDWNGNVVTSQASQRTITVANNVPIEMLFYNGSRPSSRPERERVYGVRAVNNLGLASATVPFTVLAPTRPDITGVTVGGTPDKPSMTVNWTPPLSAGGAPVSTVTAMVRGKDLPKMSIHINSSVWISGWYSCTAPVAAGSCTITGLQPGLVYLTRAFAENAYGRSMASTWPGLNVGFDRPSAVRNIRTQWVTRAGGQRNLYVDFDPPVSEGRADVMFYELREAGSKRVLDRLNKNWYGGNIFEFELKPGDSRQLEIVPENNAGLKGPATAFTVRD